MSLVKQASTYKATPVSKSVKRSFRIFDQHDSTARVLTCLVYKHRAGLKSLTIVALVSYIAYDKISFIF